VTRGSAEKKKHDTAVEESGLIKLKEDIKAMTGLQHSERFINLATESISLDEYSQHFITLTIHWRAPFQQTDVCFIYRKDGGKAEWTSQDTDDLRAL
jgi:hypothetical protein